MLKQLDFDKAKLEIVDIDDIVFHPGPSEVRLPLGQFGRIFAIAGFEQQPAMLARDNDVIVIMPVPAGFGTGFEAPLGNDDSLVFNLPASYGFGSVCFHE